MVGKSWLLMGSFWLKVEFSRGDHDWAAGCAAFLAPADGRAIDRPAWAGSAFSSSNYFRDHVQSMRPGHVSPRSYKA